MKKNQYGFSALLILGLMVLAICGGFVAYRVSTQQSDKADSQKTTPLYSKSGDTANDPSYVTKQFIRAMKAGDAQKTNSFLTTDFQAKLKSQAGINNYYDFCSRASNEGIECIDYYTDFQVDKSTINVTSETAENGGDIKMITPCANTTLNGQKVNACIDFEMVQNSKDWQINNITEQKPL